MAASGIDDSECEWIKGFAGIGSIGVLLILRALGGFIELVRIVPATRFPLWRATPLWRKMSGLTEPLCALAICTAFWAKFINER